jgi:hypothetical protein
LVQARGNCTETVKVANYRKNKYYPRIVHAVVKILSRSNVLALK